MCGHLRQQRAERDAEPGPAGASDLGELAAVGAPPQLGLACRRREHVLCPCPGSCRRRSPWPATRSGGAQSSSRRTCGAGGGEVVELLRVDVGHQLGIPAVDEVPGGRGGGVARVVPALEGGDHDRLVQRRDGSSSGRGPSLHRTVGGLVGGVGTVPSAQATTSHDPTPARRAPRRARSRAAAPQRRVGARGARSRRGRGRLHRRPSPSASTTARTARPPPSSRSSCRRAPSVVDVPAVAGWTSAVDESARTVTWSGGPVPDGTEARAFPSSSCSRRRPGRCCSRRSSRRPRPVRSPGSRRRRARARRANPAPRLDPRRRPERHHDHRRGHHDDGSRRPPRRTSCADTTLEAEQRDDGTTSAAPWLIGSAIAALVAIGVGGLLLKRRAG